jgi:hypothetical protein
LFAQEITRERDMSFSKFSHKTARAGYSIQVCIRFKHIRDTIKECERESKPWGPYVNGATEPHFPVPSLMGEVFIGSHIIAVCRAEVRVWDGSVIEWLKED